MSQQFELITSAKIIVITQKKKKSVEDKENA